MTAQPEILPPLGTTIATTRDLVARLARHFPKHAAEIAEWAGMYQRALGALSAARLLEVFEATLAEWKRSSPPKPADFAAKASSAALAGQAADKDELCYRHADGEMRCTAKGYERAQWLTSRMVESALQHAPEQLTPDEAYRCGKLLKDAAWLAACREVITGTAAQLEVTLELLARVRLGIQRAATDPKLRLWARTGLGAAMERAAPPPPPPAAQRTSDALRAAAQAHHARVMGEQPEAEAPL